MNKKLVVELFVPETPGSDIGECATGYPVAPNLILTAKHVLGDGAHASPQVRWPKIAECCEWREAEVVPGPFSDQLDVVLLRVPFPDEIKEWGYLLEDNPNEIVTWRSFGFPEVGSEGIPVWGTLDCDDDNLELVVEGAPPNDEGWEGISGSAVIIEQSDAIAGVIVTCPRNFSGQRLRAIPSWQLLTIPEFRQLVQFDRRNCARICAKLKGFLDTMPRACEAMRDHEELENQDVSTIEKLALALMNLKIDKLLRLCDHVRAELVDEGVRDQSRFLVGMVNYLLPYVCDQSLIDKAKATPKGFVCRLPVATKSLLEVVMAGREGRAACFEVNSEDGMPYGPNLLQKPPAHGMDQSGFVANFKKEIIRAFVHETQFADGREKSEKEKLDIARDELEDCSKEDKQTRYYFYALPENVPSAKSVESNIAELRKLFPSIVFVACVADHAASRFESRYITRPLTKIHQSESGG